MKRINTKALTLCALFAALSAALSQVSVPIGPVPINLAHVSIFMAAGLLGAGYGAISQIAFVALGAFGLPVFSGFSGGIGIVLGPTGGYIVAYILTAFVTGLILEHFGRKSAAVLFVAIYVGWVITYAFGTAWYSFVTGTGLVPALMLCVVPFLIGDCLKTILCVFALKRLSPLFVRPIIARQ